MADERENPGSEEEKKGGGNDDDFGLPDFEFEALDDDDEDEEESTSEPELTTPVPTPPPVEAPPVKEPEPPAEEVSPPPVPEPVSETSTEETVTNLDEDLDVDDLDIDMEDLDDIDLEGVDLDDIDLENMDLDDIDRVLEERMSSDSPKEIEEPQEETPTPPVESPVTETEAPTTESLESSFGEENKEESEEVVDEFELDSTSEGDNLFYEEETYDEFDSPEPTVVAEGEGVGTTFVQQTEVEMAVELSPEETGRAKKKFIRIVIAGTLMFLVVAFGFYYLYQEYGTGETEQVAEAGSESTTQEGGNETGGSTPPPVRGSEDGATGNVDGQSDKTETASPPPVKEPEAKQETQTKAPEKKTTERKQTPSRQTTSTASGIERLPRRTNKYYLIVGSFVNDARAYSYAKKMGSSAYIIPPFNGAANHRVAVAGFGSLSEAKRNISTYEGKYPGVWPLKY